MGKRLQRREDKHKRGKKLLALIETDDEKGVLNALPEVGTYFLNNSLNSLSNLPSIVSSWFSESAKTVYEKITGTTQPIAYAATATAVAALGGIMAVQGANNFSNPRESLENKIVVAAEATIGVGNLVEKLKKQISYLTAELSIADSIIRNAVFSDPDIVTRETLDRYLVAPLVAELSDSVPNIDLLINAIIDESTNLDVSKILFSLSITYQECRNRHGFEIDENGELRLTKNKVFIKKYLISDLGAVGCGQGMPFLVEEYDIPFIDDPSFHEGWNFLNQETAARERRDSTGTRLLRYSRNSNSENPDQTELNLRDLYNQQHKQYREFRRKRIDKFATYENLVADSIAGKTDSELKLFEGRASLTVTAAFLDEHIGDLCMMPETGCDPLKVYTRYFSQFTDETRTRSIIAYAYNARQEFRTLVVITSAGYLPQNYMEWPLIASDESPLKTPSTFIEDNGKENK